MEKNEKWNDKYIVHCYYPKLHLEIAGWVANSVDPDEIPHSAAFHLDLYCLLRPVCRNTYGKYGTHAL